MGDNRNNLNLGDQILKAVDDILESGNFDKLNSVVSDTVYKALDEAKKQLEKVTVEVNVGTGTKKGYGQSNQTGAKASAGAGANSGAKASAGAGVNSGAKTSAGAGVYSGAKAAADAEVKNKAERTQVVSCHSVPTPKAKIQRVGSVAGVLFQVFGGIGTGVFGILFLIFFLGVVMGQGSAGLALFMGALACVSGALIVNGAEKRARLKRAERYIQVMQGKSYINLSDLALLTNKSERAVRKDIKKMIRMGIFPEGHLDQQEKCLMLNDTAYREYMRLEKRRNALALEAEEQKRLEEKTKGRGTAQQWPEGQNAVQSAGEEQVVPGISLEKTDNEELNAMIQEGNRCIRQLRDLNDAIEGEVISQKLFQLENLLKEIFEQVKEHPEQMPEMYKFMDYYLPTTLKLVTAYEEFDRVSVPGEDILSAKAEIEKTLDTINMAFAELLNKLFRDRAFDAATDAQVLKTMLAREGLTKEPVFVKRNTTEALEK